jgi:hypothetical protein
MNSTRYKLLGFLVWRGGKLYLRRAHPRLFAKRSTATGAAGALLLLAAAAAAAVGVRARG